MKGLIKGDGSWYERECIVRATTPNVMEFKSSVGREVSSEREKEILDSVGEDL